ncbi:hypothetical protein [Bacillus sp. FJAT-52991]|uniref:Uncharacterized protein n=1 Tax=Bacillus kandeliae TaxID=3129297 RepID=A0ABZ2NBM5_9BACI
MIMEIVEQLLTNPNIHEWSQSASKLCEGVSQSELNVIINTFTSLENNPMLQAADTWK